MTLALGIDIGTSGLRASVIDRSEREVQGAARALAPDQRRDPRSWRAALTSLLDDLTLGDVTRVAVDGTSGTLLGLDTAGEPVGPPLMYDDRVPDAALVAQLDAAAPTDATARGAGSGAAKTARLLDQGAARVCHQADWLGSLLTGRADLTDENNALKTGYDPTARQWPGWLSEAGVDIEALPAVHPVGTPLAPLTRKASARFGFPANAALHAGTTDGCASFLATGASRPGDGVTALGSTLVVKLLSEKPVSAPDYGVYSHRIGDVWLAGGASNTGGAVLAQHFTPAELAALSARIDPTTDAAGGPYYPLTRPGERFPINDPHHAPAMPPRHDDAAFLHGLLTGMADIEALGYARLAELGAPNVARLFTVGGGARNPIWSALRARKTGAALAEPHSADAAYGTARVALGVVGDAP